MLNFIHLVLIKMQSNVFMWCQDSLISPMKPCSLPCWKKRKKKKLHLWHLLLQSVNALLISQAKPQVTMTPHVCSDRDNFYHHWLDCHVSLVSFTWFTLSEGPTWLPVLSYFITSVWKDETYRSSSVPIIYTRRIMCAKRSQNSFCHRQLSHQTALPTQQFSSLNQWQLCSQAEVQYKPV